MKKILYSLLFILAIAGHSYGDTVVDGVDGGGGGVSEGDDVTFGFGVFSSVLDNATGDEVALSIEYITNKATSGNDTGLFVNQVDTASPGTSLLMDLRKDSVSKFKVDNAGKVTATAVLAPIISTAASNQTLIVQNKIFNNADTAVLMVTATMGQGEGEEFIGVSIEPIYNQTGTAAATDLRINRSGTTGSGDQLLFDAQVDDVSKFSIDNNGSSDTGGAVAFSGISTVTADYVIGNFEDDPTWFIECDATLGNISTTLPPVADKKGRLLEVNLVSAANGCYLDGNGAETISGETGKAITIQYNSVSLIAGSTQWLIY